MTIPNNTQIKTFIFLGVFFKNNTEILISCNKLHSSWIHEIESNLGHLTDDLLQSLQLILCNQLLDLFQTPTSRCTPTLPSHAHRGGWGPFLYCSYWIHNISLISSTLITEQNEHINQDTKTQHLGNIQPSFLFPSCPSVTEIWGKAESCSEDVLQCCELKAIQTSITQLDARQNKQINELKIANHSVVLV